MTWKIRTRGRFLVRSGQVSTFDTPGAAMAVADAYNRRHGPGAYPAECGPDGELTPACQAAEVTAMKYLLKTLWPESTL